MTWKLGTDVRLTFSGTFLVASSPKEYSGNFGGIGPGVTGQPVKGAAASC